MADPIRPSRAEVTVAIPVRDGGPLFATLLDALAQQSVEHELLVCDSGSRDGSPALALERGARLITIAPEDFGHGRTRNLLVDAARGKHVALLSQDAVPADERWLERLLDAFSVSRGVGLAYGPYIPRPDAPAHVRLELTAWFGSLAPGGLVRVDRLDAGSPPADGGTQARVAEVDPSLVGRLGFFTDANACIAREAWERVPFRDIAYAEDRALALDMLRAGYAKVYVPDAAVIHSHDFGPVQQLRRCFDEWRGLLEVYGWREPVNPVRLASQLRGELARAQRELSSEGIALGAQPRTLASVFGRRALCIVGATLGSRADRLPEGLQRKLSFERRTSVPPRRPRGRAADSVGP